ncbi:hypothetical protein Purlil1_11398 [Purpureocillium lilacinum]|uniref:Uncharacterized protein n=1 Tax=Purpureocillium lilacinum TaxID=33203 RepID=A0ABR0BJQ4_PURLI|nr:hypothetical protein Purlil1_11398 [Purpureocillium lilacinum]
MVTASSKLHLRLCPWAGGLRALAATSPTTSQMAGTVVPCKVSAVFWPIMRCLVSLPYMAHGSSAYGNGNDARASSLEILLFFVDDSAVAITLVSGDLLHITHTARGSTEQAQAGPSGRPHLTTLSEQCTIPINVACVCGLHTENLRRLGEDGAHDLRTIPQPHPTGSSPPAPLGRRIASHRRPPRAMSRASKPPRCVGSPSFRPDEVVDDAPRLQRARDLLAKDDLYEASRALLGLPERDTYTYHATASVKLAEVQHVVRLGGVNGLHGWYRNEDGSPRDPPPRADIDAYIAIFNPATATASALKNFGTNAKKGSIRAEAAARLLEKRYVHPALSSKLTVPKAKSPPSQNPYYDFWAWSCRNLEWCGPCASSERVATSHHVLPILMHHFGCATPSHEALEVLRLLAAGRAVADVGSGNGYWTFLLRRYGLTVHPVDNMQSEWRVNWVDDTSLTDGVKWLAKQAGGKDMVLLLVYPVVGGDGKGAFTRDLVRAYRGDTLAVVGTQNGNGYTGFRDVTMDEYMRREQPEWTRVVQIPLPSFAGKDEALYVFQRGERVPQTTPPPP